MQRHPKLLAILGPIFGICGFVALSACTPPPQTSAIEEPDPELTFVRGYRSAEDQCQLTGESAFTIDFLDDAADLVACPTGSRDDQSLRSQTGAPVLTQTQSFSLYSIATR